MVPSQRCRASVCRTAAASAGEPVVLSSAPSRACHKTMHRMREHLGCVCQKLLQAAHRSRHAAAGGRRSPGHPKAEAQGTSSWLHYHYSASAATCPAAMCVDIVDRLMSCQRSHCRLHHRASRQMLRHKLWPGPAACCSPRQSNCSKEHLPLQAEALSELAAAVCGLQQFLADAPQVLPHPVHCLVTRS